MPSSLFIRALVTVIVLAISSPVAAELRAGVARVDLTPPLDIKASLGGYGARMSKPAVGVHDRIFAKALVLSDGSKRFALVTADILGFPPGFEAVLTASLSGAGWKSDQVMLLPSHSHSSIDMSAINPKNILGIPQIGIFNKALYEMTLTNLAKVIAAAGENLVPVSIGTSQIQLDGWNRNRRKGGTTSDRDLTVTRIDKTDGTPLAVLINWTAHPTLMGPEDMMFSGGWPGHLQRTVEALIGQGVTVMYYNGAQGDQSPTPRDRAGSNWEQAERYGRELGIVAWRQWEKTKPNTVPATISYTSEPITLPKAQPHADFMQTGGSEYGLNQQIIGTIITLLVPSRTASPSLRLGDLLIVGIPGEMTAGLGLSVKSEVRRATGAQHVTIGGLADEWISYILTAEEYKKGGYETSVSFYGETLGQVVAEAAIRGASRLSK